VFELSDRSKERMQGVHPDLVAVINRAIEITDIDFTVLEGLRSEHRQRKLFNSGASKTMNSRHLTGHAIDIAPYVNGEVSWHWPHYHKLAPAVKQAADELGVIVEWGGDWKSFKDGPHWQLPWDVYGKGDMKSKATGKPPRKSMAQSSTLQATAVSAVGGAGTLTAALSQLDGTVQLVILGFAGLGLLSLIWIARERIKKWAEGVR
jgi:peptidoglycan L-alanyl-D-glutamate endopeptidase CwlK